MKKTIKIMMVAITVMAIASVFLVPSVIAADTPKTIVETAVGAGSFNTLVAAVTAAGLVDTLSGPGPFTVFAPTDEAFEKLPDGTIDALLADPSGQLTDILLFHVVSGKVMAADVVNLKSATSVSGRILPIDTTDGVKVAGAKVVVTDIECSNGVIHVIDTVMIPPAAKYSVSDTGVAGFVTYLYNNLLGRNPDVDGLNTWAGWLESGAMAADTTVSGILASSEAQAMISGYSDDMFVKYLYMGLFGRNPSSDEVSSWTNILASGVSRMDAVKHFTRSTEFILLCSKYGVKPFTTDLGTIPETAVKAGTFSTLVAAVTAAGLAETLSGPGPFTVFAPTDAAFAKLPAGTVEALLADPTGQLKNILLFHVVSGKVMAADVVNLTSAPTVLGQDASIEIKDGKVYVDGAQVIVTDIMCSNGVIHVIDTVMLP
ncbi:MAG: fasciclin domain-containing protein [Actinobacteria bacterium]|nr:fasciclin domain-containing protein [Actinomycetota bacterium]